MTEYIINGLFIIVILIALALLVYSRNPQSNMTNKQRKMLLRILVATIFLLVIELLPSSLFEGRLGYLFNLTLYLIDYLIIGYDILLKALKGIKNKQVLDECFLMTLATLGAIALALYERSSDYTKAIAVMLFYQIGEWFQSYAVGKSRRNISDLMDIRPDFANVEIDGKLQKVDPDEVAIGTIITVKPGEKVPLDGIVCEGESSLDTSALTGESVPRDIKTGDDIISGSINMSGLLKIKTTKEFGESTVSKILDLVEMPAPANQDLKTSSQSLPGSIRQPSVSVLWLWPSCRR